jgi:hypothetical protein
VRKETGHEVINDIGITGDFSLFPKRELSVLEQELRDTVRSDEDIENRIEEFYEETDVQTPGVKPKDFKKAIMEAE